MIGKIQILEKNCQELSVGFLYFLGYESGLTYVLFLDRPILPETICLVYFVKKDPANFHV